MSATCGTNYENPANARGLALLGASLLNIKTLFCWFSMFSGFLPLVKIVEIFNKCVKYIGLGYGNPKFLQFSVLFNTLYNLQPFST